MHFVINNYTKGKYNESNLRSSTCESGRVPFGALGNLPGHLRYLLNNSMDDPADDKRDNRRGSVSR